MTFIEPYSRTGLKPAVLREAYQFLTNDESAIQQEIDACVVEALMDADDPEILCVLKKNNENRQCTELEPFWQEIQTILNERGGAQHEHAFCRFIS